MAKLDRLSRTVVDFAGVLELARARKWALVAIDLGVDTLSPTGELAANVMTSVAQWERRVIGERTSAAMQAAKRQDRHMGRASGVAKSAADHLLELSAGRTPAMTTEQLNVEGLATPTGALWFAKAVAKVQKLLNAA